MQGFLELWRKAGLPLPATVSLALTGVLRKLLQVGLTILLGLPILMLYRAY